MKRVSVSADGDTPRSSRSCAFSRRKAESASGKEAHAMEVTPKLARAVHEAIRDE